MAQLLTVRLTRGDAQPWGFRLQGGKDFGTPLLIQKVNSGSLADQVGLIAGDAVIKINGTEVFDLRHKDAQDVVVRAGNNVEIAVQRGGSTWKPNVTPTGHLPSPNQYGGLAHVTKTSLAHKTPDGRPISAIGTGYNNAARPFNSPTGAPVKSIVNKQYNTPVGIYSDETIAETLSAQAEVLAGGVLGVNFKKNEKMYNSANSEVYKMLQEQSNDPEEPAQQETHIVTPQPTTRPLPQVHVQPAPSASVTKHVTAPIDRPLAPQSNGLPPGQNICAECERLIVGVFVRIKDKNLHAECFKCATCGSSLKNQGYYNVNNKLYCDVHARQAAIQKPPQGTQGYSPVPIKPESKIGANIIQAALQSKSASNQFNGTSQNNINNPYAAPKPYNYSQPPQAGPKSPSSYPPAAPSWSQPQGNQVNQGKFNTFGPSYQDQYDDQQHQKSFIPTNRPVTPSLINKPAPTIPYYQQNLCPIDCKPTESHVFDPHSRSPSPHPERAKSPAPGPPPNPLRAVCPRIKDKPITKMNKQLETEIKTQVAEKAEQKTYSLVGFKNMPAQEKQSLPLTNVQSAIKPITTYTAATSQFADVTNASNYNIEKHASAAKFTEIPKTVHQAKIGDTNIQTTVQGSAMAQQHKSEKQSSQTTNVGNKQIQRRTRVVEEFERSRSEKQMEIVKTQGDMSRRVTFEQNACGGAAAAAIANSNDISKKEGFVAKQARRLSQDTSDLQKFPITVDLSRPMTHFPSISSSPKVRHEQNLPRLDGFSLPETPCSINQLSSNTKAQSATSYKSQQKHEDQMNTLTQHHKQELQQKSIASTSTTAAYTNANQQLLATYNKFETAPTTAMNVNNTKYPQSITKSSYPPKPVSSKIQAPASTISQKLTQQKITPNAVVSDSSPASAGSNSTKGGVFGATTAPKRGRGTLNKAVGPGARVPLCGCCNTQIRGPFITALGRIWCPDHFVCSTSNCRRQLQDIGFVEEKNQLYCEFCFEKYLAPSCSKCNSKIKGDCLNAIGKHYHPECFTCTYCGKLFGNSAFFLEEGDAYCEADWNELFTTKCFACGFPVEAGDRWVEALNNNYHSQCFNCSMCKKNLEGQSFVAKGGRPFCKNHAR